ncbi:hypothetical protein J6396_39570, partial [Pseudomonas aeruginosa]|nr:hypothetical protein [Pseudomonas aeruginosa]
ETRRVLIARALVNRPQALLLDEPSTGLDLVAREQLVATMRVLAQQGITLVLVTHHIEEIIPEIERVVLLRDGRVLADGTRAELLRSAPLSAVFGGPITVCEQEGRLTAYAGGGGALGGNKEPGNRQAWETDSTPSWCHSRRDVIPAVTP